MLCAEHGVSQENTGLQTKVNCIKVKSVTIFWCVCLWMMCVHTLVCVSKGTCVIALGTTSSLGSCLSPHLNRASLFLLSLVSSELACELLRVLHASCCRNMKVTDIVTTSGFYMGSGMWTCVLAFPRQILYPLNHPSPQLLFYLITLSNLFFISFWVG